MVTVATNDFGLLCLGIFVFAIIILFLYSKFQGEQRKKLLKSIKAGGEASKSEGSPVLLLGETADPVYELPSTGEKCAFYAVRILSKKTGVKKDYSFSVGTSVAGIPIGKRFQKGMLKGFETSKISGNFTILSPERNKYLVDVEGYFDSMLTGMKAFVEPAVDIATKYTMEDIKNVDKSAEMGKISKVTKSLLGAVFGNRVSKSVSKRRSKILIKSESTTTIAGINASSNVDIKVSEYIVGQNTPDGIMKMLEEKGILNVLAETGDEIYVLETYIPLHKKVYVAGTYTVKDGKETIAMKDSKVLLSVSYNDPSV
ncbi:hypothetical protein KAW38_02595 [Candidatus Micrarchaeota archaeon]|nr:hypothetical protein [Candidatus Micrarchaeota archaeon]